MTINSEPFFLKLWTESQNNTIFVTIINLGAKWSRSADRTRYFVEKDFPCAHPRTGDAMEKPSETFKPPAGFEARKVAESEP
jgi:hypothetical protein